MITRLSMNGQETVLTKKRGPKPTGKGTLVGVRLQPDQLAALDHWISEQGDPKPTRPEAVRRLLDATIGARPHTVISRLGETRLQAE